MNSYSEKTFLRDSSVREVRSAINSFRSLLTNGSSFILSVSSWIFLSFFLSAESMSSGETIEGTKNVFSLKRFYKVSPVETSRTLPFPLTA